MAITINMTKAKELFKDKIRTIRKPLLEAEDVVYIKALETDDADAKSASVTKKQKLRDATDTSSIANATSEAELKSAWDTDLLGTNPYS
tara:strand:+ start:1304 stop:1570 length:267 start_codon:yes stop_codon:yes gene_type:complete